MTRRQDIRDQADRANDVAIQGGIDGGIRWFLGGVIVFGTAQIVWPMYRGLTLPFKVFSAFLGADCRHSYFLQVNTRASMTDLQ